MVLVDSSVWVDFFRERVTAQTHALDSLIGREEIAVGDLILTEVLQGFEIDREYATARRLFASLPLIDIAGGEVALLASTHYRLLRSRGVTIRKTVDTLIASRCILDGLTLLHCDRDFSHFADHLGLQVYDLDEAAATRLH